MSQWAGYILDNVRYEFDAGSRFLDVGCSEKAEFSASPEAIGAMSRDGCRIRAAHGS